jgi:hypothetical protein
VRHKILTRSEANLRYLLWTWLQLLMLCCAIFVFGFVFAVYAGHIIAWLRIGGQLVWPTLDNVLFASLCALGPGFILATGMTWETWTGR